MTSKVDDQSIGDPDPLWRRIHPTQFVSDGSGSMRASSAAFNNSNDGTGMSVSLAREAQAAGVTAAMALDHFPTFGLASLTAGVCRGHRQTIERDPTHDDRHHALVNGEKPKSVRNALTRAAIIVIAPTRVSDQ